jgi:hypothetical protein
MAARSQLIEDRSCRGISKPIGVLDREFGPSIADCSLVRAQLVALMLCASSQLVLVEVLRLFGVLAVIGMHTVSCAHTWPDGGNSVKTARR